MTVGFRAEPVLEAGMRLAPGERQSGDGTSLPETPNNLTNVCTTNVKKACFFVCFLEKT